jgi:hypothetical protein
MLWSKTTLSILMIMPPDRGRPVRPFAGEQDKGLNPVV